MPRTRMGKVTLVGAGPGDPGLLTLNALEALRRADVVVFDRLVGPGVLRCIPKPVIQIPAESLGRHGDARQHGIHRALVEHARRGLRVVRLKGGDPFVFGRGQEEVEALEAHGVPWELVPGITSATAGPAAAGIPVSHRDASSVITIATGHEARGRDEVPWERIAALRGTIVVLMCSDRIGGIVRRLRKGGLPASTPATVVSRATLPTQEVRRASLGRIADVLARNPVMPPALLVVGEVAALGVPNRRALPSGRARAHRRSLG
ncbi:MAG: uroporphyrinogen-III C-methyltransferase [Methanobacteriota archaeon]